MANINTEINIGDVIFFTEKFNEKKNKNSFIGRTTDFGKIIISKDNRGRSGFFEIKEILRNEENFALVKLGNRVQPVDLYPEISLNEAKKVLINLGFEIYEEIVSFKDNGKDTTETQLLAWNNELGIWVNGTTRGGEIFNNLDIRVPNIYHSCHKISSGIWKMDENEIVVDVCKINNNCPPERCLVWITGIIRSHPNTKAKIILKNDMGCISGLYSYLYHIHNSRDTLNTYIRYEKELFKKLPESAKEFINQHTE